MVDLNKTALFAKVVEAGSFSGAARALGLPKTSVSRQVMQLEEALGVRLLHRTTRKLEVTAMGRAYYEEATLGLRHFDIANRRALAARSIPSGVLRVSAVVEFGARFLTDWIAEFLSMFEQVGVELTLKDGPVDHVSERIDLAFQFGPLSDVNLIARKMWSAKKILLASPAYLQQRGDPRSPDDLARHDFVMAGRSLDDAVIQLESAEGVVPIRTKGRFCVDSTPAALRAATLGLGIVAVPEMLAREALGAGLLRRVLAKHELQSGAIFATYPSKEHMSAALRGFLDFVADKQPHYR